MNRASISREATFTAEHQPPGFERHTNAFRLRVTVEGPILDGILMRAEALRFAVDNAARVADCLSFVEVLPQGSSVEQMCVWFWDQLVEPLPLLTLVELEDDGFVFAYRGPG